MRSLILFLLFVLIISSCEHTTSQDRTLVNTGHLDHLYEALTFKEEPAAIVHIYAEAPDYVRTAAPGEGIACIDDIARAAVFYLRHFKYTEIASSEEKARRLLNFVLLMQAENGYFYNFLDENYAIEKDTYNSQPLGDWWSWRALWALTEAIPVYQQKDEAFVNRLSASVKRAFKTATQELNLSYPSESTFDGILIPAWLPGNYAADQTAVLLLALTAFYKINPGESLLTLINRQADALLQMQKGGPEDFPYGAFLSWKNLWHAYGNSQSDALLKTCQITGSESFKRSALMEIDYFYPFLQQQGYFNWFTIAKTSHSIVLLEQKKYEQIAYGIRPMVFACLTAYSITGDTVYARRAGDIGCWLLGKNEAGKALYQPESGICYDGLDGPGSINLNSGAESTIEALLTIQELEQNSVSKKILHSYYQGKTRRK